MTDETRLKDEDRILKIAKLAEEICESVHCCKECPLDQKCFVESICDMAAEIKQNREPEPTHKELPIDLDDDYHCDECDRPAFNGCFDKSGDDCPYGLGECCEDNLATNVGRICFDHNIPTNFAMAIIEIIQKERDRNEYLHIYREHIPAE